MSVLIVGASLGGVRLAEALRAASYDDRIVLVGDEFHLPYDRPPLSKGFLLGEVDHDDLALRDCPTLEDLEVELHLGRRAISLYPSDGSIELDDGSLLGGDNLVVATGARARQMPGVTGQEGVHTLRTLDDAIALRAGLAEAESLLVVGAGFIGSEVASAGRQLGLPVTVAEAAKTPYSRLLDEALASRLAQLHGGAGSRLLCGTSISRLDGVGRNRSAVLSDGSRVGAELIVVGIGSVPATDWVASTGVNVVDGILCASNGRARGMDRVYAIGDVARWESERYGDAVRMEHWTAVGDQAQVVAATIVGAVPPPEAVPYVWSDQFGSRIQIGGRCRSGDEWRVLRDGESLAAAACRGGRVVAALTIDDHRSFAKLRRYIVRDARWEEVRLM